jgi:hypothetical protein
MKKIVAAFVIMACLPAAMCTRPDQPGIQIRTVEVVREVQRPCPVVKPQRPSQLAKPLPTDAVQLAALLGAKLLEWAGPGGYGERADAALARCIS